MAAPYRACQAIHAYSVGLSWRGSGTAREAKPTFDRKEIRPSSLWPFFVVITMTPFAAREPYREVAAASLRTVMDSMSLGAMALM